MSSGKYKTPYPVARPFTPPAEHRPRKAHWAGLVALAAVVAFLCTGLILLINCLQPEADAPKTESWPELEQASRDLGGFKLGVETAGPRIVYEGKPPLPSTPPDQTPPNQEQEPPERNRSRNPIEHEAPAASSAGPSTAPSQGPWPTAELQ